MYFDHHLTFFQFDVKDQSQLLDEMVTKLQENGFVKDTYRQALKQREEEYPTGILFEKTGFAIPHTDSKHVNQSQICFASLKNPIEFKDMTNKENSLSVELVFMLAMAQPHEQVEMLQNLMSLFQDVQAVEKLKKCTNEREFAEILSNANVY